MANGYRDPYGYMRQTISRGQPIARPVQRAIQPAPMPPALPAAPTAGAVRGGGVGRMMQAVPGGLAEARQRAQQARAAESLLMPEAPRMPEQGLLGGFAAGTPSAAGLGAAGRELLRLGGPQRTPLSLGQILGQATGVGLEAYKTRQQEIASAKQKQEQEAYKRRMDELGMQLKLGEAQREQEKALRPFGTRTQKVVGEGGRVFETTFQTVPVLDDQGNITGYKQQEVGSVPLPFEAPKEKTSTISINGILHEQRQRFDPETGQYVDIGEPYPKYKPGDPKPGSIEGVIHKDGVFVSQAVEKNGVIYKKIDGELVEMANDEIFTKSDEWDDKVLTAQQMSDLKKTVNDGQRSLRRLSEYASNRLTAGQGVGLLADQFMGMIKTALGKGLTPSQLAAAVAEGQLQSLIGQFRIETVGGGVMTEQDALRIIAALGGDVSALANRQVVMTQIKNILGEKVKTVQGDADTYNGQVGYYYGPKQGYKPIAVEQVDTTAIDNFLNPPALPRGTVQ